MSWLDDLPEEFPRISASEIERQIFSRWNLPEAMLENAQSNRNTEIRMWFWEFLSANLDEREIESLLLFLQFAAIDLFNSKLSKPIERKLAKEERRRKRREAKSIEASLAKFSEKYGVKLSDEQSSSALKQPSVAKLKPGAPKRDLSFSLHEIEYHLAEKLCNRNLPYKPKLKQPRSDFLRVYSPYYDDDLNPDGDLEITLPRLVALFLYAVGIDQTERQITEHREDLFENLKLTGRLYERANEYNILANPIEDQESFSVRRLKFEVDPPDTDQATMS